MNKVKTSKENKKNKASFFKNFLISIKDFDKYGIFLKERTGQSVLYLLILLLFFVIIITALESKGVIDDYYKIEKELKDQIKTIKYENERLTINDNEKTEINNSELLGNVIIDTSELTEEQLSEYKDELDKFSGGSIILNNKAYFVIQDGGIKGEIVYSELEQGNAFEASILKNIIDNWNNDYNKTTSNATIIGILFLGEFYNILIDSILNALFLAVICYLTSRIIKVALKFSESFRISIHALTLPIILNLIYGIIRIYTSFTMPYFAVMYYGVGYVYIVTAIFMMKSDNIKMQLELKRIKEVEEQIKEEMELELERKKEKQEKDDVKNKDKETEKKDTKKKDSNKKRKPQIQDKPEGNNA